MKRAYCVGFLAIALLILACGDNDPPTGPTSGSITVNVTSTGEDAPTGYTVVLDGSVTRTVGANASATFGSVSTGTREVELTDVPANCTVTSANPATVSVSAGVATPVAMSVICNELVGSIEISVTSIGADIPLSYTVALDGGTTHSVGANGSVTFTSVSVGSHEVELTDLPANCSVTGANPLTVDVTFGAQTPGAMAIQCSALAGAIEITVTSAGDDIPNQYQLIVDDGAPQPVDANGSVSITGLSPGPHTIDLTEIPQNCTVTSDNPVTATVTANETTSIATSVECEALVGLITVTAATTGEADADGYLVSVNGEAPQVVEANGSVTFADVPTGENVVAIDGIADNCALNGTITRNVTVFPGETANETYQLRCDWSSQIAFTTGRDGDYEVYVMNPDGTDPVNVSHCLAADDVGNAWSSDGAWIAYRSQCQGGMQIFAVHVATTDVRPQTDEGQNATHRGPQWSPDGSRIAMTSYPGNDAEVYVVAFQNPNIYENLTNTPGTDTGPRWSPDGSRIAFSSERDGNSEVYVMNADGSNPVNLTNHPGYDGQPEWSPDGSRIAFLSDRDGNSEIYVMNADGSAPIRLTTNAWTDGRPVWSPDGSQLLLTGYPDDYGEVYKVSSDGATLERLTDSAGDNGFPGWSPDGTRIVFGSSRDGDNAIYVMDADGSNQERISPPNASDIFPSWSPRLR